MMNNVLSFFKERFNGVFLCFGIVTMITVLGVSFFALPNNLIFSDEGWYLCLLRDVPRYGGWTRFYLLFNNCFNNNIYVIRLVCWASQLCGSIVLAWGITCWLGQYSKDTKKGILFLYSLCALYFGQMRIVDCPSFNYITMNLVCAEVGIGTLLVGLATQKSVFFAFSGFFISFLFPIMIPNVVIIPLMFAAIVLISHNRIKDALLFVVGVALFFLYYFLLVETPREVGQFLVDGTKSTVSKGGDDYGIKFFFLWFLEAIMYYSKYCLVAITLFVVNKRIFNRDTVIRQKHSKVLVACGVSTIILLYSWAYLKPTTLESFKGIGTFRWFKDLYWIFLFMLLISDAVVKKRMDKNEMVLCGLLMSVPLCLCFGSNKSFVIRQDNYYVFITPLIVYLAIRNGLKWRGIMLLLFALGFGLFIRSSINGTNWYGDKHFGKQVSVTTVGIQQNVRLDNQYIKRLIYCKDIIPKNERVLCSCDEWGIAVLLGYVPVNYEFDYVGRNTQDLVQKLVDDEVDNRGHLWAISTNKESDFVEKLLLVQGCEVQVDSDDENVYVFFSR